MFNNIIMGILMAGMVRQLFVNASLRRQVYENEVELYALSSQCRGLAESLGYTIVTPANSQGRL